MNAHQLTAVTPAEGRAYARTMNQLDIPSIRAAYPISSVIGASIKLQRAGREFVACCPFHPDRSPSFAINDEKGFAHCFGCGWHGDVLDFIQKAEGVGLREAAERLGSGALPVVATPRPEPKPERDTTAEAVAIWRQAAPVAGTPAESYLRTRGLICRIPESIRFARLKYGNPGQLHPCLIALAASIENKAVGIQRTYLNDSGTGKAAVPKPKLSLGRIRGAAIRLAPAATEMVVTEGLEDALTLQQELGVAAWAAAGAGMMSSMQLPPGVRSVIIGADRDQAGERAARQAADRFSEQISAVRIVRPMPGFKDFNAELQGA